jgi:hypothetical protein
MIKKETTMTITARLLVAVAALCLWVGAAHADLDDIRRSAESGNSDSQLELGILFQFGFNLKDNEVPALAWYAISANQGNAKAAKLRDALMSKMSARDIAEAMEQVKQFKPTGAAAPAPAESGAAPTSAAPAVTDQPASSQAVAPTSEPTPAAGESAAPATGTAPEPPPAVTDQPAAVPAPTPSGTAAPTATEPAAGTVMEPTPVPADATAPPAPEAK